MVLESVNWGGKPSTLRFNKQDCEEFVTNDQTRYYAYWIGFILDADKKTIAFTNQVSIKVTYSAAPVKEL
jgi:hypothetical protein